MKAAIICAILPLAFASTASAQGTLGTGVTSIIPADGTTGVPLNARIIVALSYPATYLTFNALRVINSYGALPGTLQVPDSSQGGAFGPPQGAFGWYVFTPARPLDPLTAYKIEVDLPALGGFPNRPPVLASFTTGTAPDTTPLQLVSSDPVAGQTGVGLGTTLKLQFDKPLNPYSTQKPALDLRDLNTGMIPYPGISQLLSPDGATDNLALANSGVILGHSFEIEFLPSSLTDWLGNPLASLPPPLLFTTLPNPPANGPQLKASVPANGDAGVPLNSSIVLIFDRPLAPLTYDAGVSVDAGGPVKFKLDTSIGGGRALTIQPTALLPPNTQVNVSVSGLIDIFGGTLAAPITFGFQSAAAAESRQLSISGPTTTPIPQNGAILVTFNRPVDAALLALGGVSLGATGFNLSLSNTVPWSLAADQRNLTISAATPLPPGAYTGYVSLPFDREQGKLMPFQIAFTVSGDVDSTTPQVVAVNPPDGTADAPPAVQIQVAFSKPVVAATAGQTIFQLLKDGNPLAGTFILSGKIGSFTPQAPLDPTASYQIQVSGLVDFEGNPLPGFSSSFMTAASSPPPTTFLVTDGSPPANAAGVDAGTTITLTFNREVNPVSVQRPNIPSVLRSVGNSTAAVPGSFQVNGPVVTFTPSERLAPGRYAISPSGIITDLQGLQVQFNSTFQVSVDAMPDTTSPVVVSVSPGDGQTVLYQNPYVVFTFSKPLNPSTVTNANFRAYTTKGNVDVKVGYLVGNQVSVNFAADAGSLVTLYVNPGVTDLAGNPAVAFRTTVVMSGPPPSLGSILIGARPNYNSSNNVPPNTSISLFFSVPMDHASVQQGLLVSVNGTLVPGALVWAPDSTAVSFTPSFPFPYSATVVYAIGWPAHDMAGNAVSYGPDSTTTLKIIGQPTQTKGITVLASNVNFPGNAPIDTVIELAFSADVPASFVTAAANIGPVNPLGGAPIGTALPCKATQVSPRVIRFQPPALLAPMAYYTFSFDSGNGTTFKVTFSTSSAVTAPNPAMIASGPVGSAVSLNTRVVVAFSAAAIELNMPQGLTLETGGTTVPTSFSWSAADRALILTPLSLLLPGMDYTVVATGFEDNAGHPIPGRTWTFHTSNAIDLTLPAILRIDPNGNAASPNASISVTFSKPVAADWIDRLVVGDAGGAIIPDPQFHNTAIPGSTRFSDDQQTLFFTPAQPLAAGHNIYIGVPVADDFAGNSQAAVAGYVLTTSTFTVAFVAPGAPSVTGATPPDGSSNLPLNVRIQAQFDQPVLASSVASVALLENGAPVPTTARVEADGRTVTAIPTRLPSAGSRYTFSVMGVQNTAGATMTGPFQTAFTIGSTVDYTSPTFRSSPAVAQLEVPVNAVIRIRFNKPLNSLTVSTRSVILSRSPFAVPINTGVVLQDSGLTIVVTPTVPLSNASLYTLTLTGVTDLVGNTFGSFPGNNSAEVSFTTSDGSSTPVTLLAVDPSDGATNFPSTGTVQAFFSQPVDLTLGDASFSVVGPNGPVPGNLSISGELLSFKSAQDLSSGAWQARLNGLEDVGGNALTPVSWNFSVSSAAADLSALRLLSSSPAGGDAGVSVSSTVTLSFNKPVSAVSAAQLHLSWQGGQIPGTFQTAYTSQGSTVTFTPAASMPGAASISVGGTIRDLNAFAANIFLQFTTGANPDRTPPTLVSSWPAAGATVPDNGTIISLRFSKPVASVPGMEGIQIYTGATKLASSGFTAGEDGQTFTSNQNFPPGTQVTVAVTSNLQDFAGNPLQPVSIQFTIASDAASRGPSVLSISPADGAVNVAVNAQIEVRFAQTMDAPSVQSGFSVTASGVLAGGTLSNDASVQTFDFQPNVPWLGGATVETFLTPVAHDRSGAQLAAMHTGFTTARPPAASAAAVGYSASTRAIDVRFQGAVPDAANDAYLRMGRTLLRSKIENVTADQIRLTPEAPLEPGVPYQLVLDANQEIVFQVEIENELTPRVTGIATDPAGFRVRFSRPVNPLSLRRGATRIVRPDGSNVSFTSMLSLDSKELILVPAKAAGQLDLVLENLEARDGGRIPTQTWERKPQ